MSGKLISSCLWAVHTNRSNVEQKSGEVWTNCCRHNEAKKCDRSNFWFHQSASRSLLVDFCASYTRYNVALSTTSLALHVACCVSSFALTENTNICWENQLFIGWHEMINVTVVMWKQWKDYIIDWLRKFCLDPWNLFKTCLQKVKMKNYNQGSLSQLLKGQCDGVNRQRSYTKYVTLVFIFDWLL